MIFVPTSNQDIELNWFWPSPWQ